MTVRVTALATVAVLVTGCVGQMMPGTIYSQDGQMLSFSIERAYNTGRVSALDPKTGETFAGSYVGIRNEETTIAHVGSYSGNGGGYGIVSVDSNIANANAFLTGDKGTVLTCSMQIQAGLSPHGIGGCDDNRGKKYRLQF